MIVIVDLGVGNLFNVLRVFNHVGIQAVITDDIEIIKSADKMVLSGVGSFKVGMDNMRTKGLTGVILQFLESGKPVLGVCLGMQMLMDYSEENGGVRGLGVISGRVRYLKSINGFLPDFTIPNIGWNTIEAGKSGWSGSVLGNVRVVDEFYFVHSLCAIAEEKYQLAVSSYAGITFSSVIQKGNVIGCQFHPEKSGDSGLKIIREFAKG
jgi:imidazole glycerol-phosphate synthase subunit HisH